MPDIELFDAGKVEGSDPEKNLVQITHSYIQEARNAKTSRMLQNRINFDCYHLRQDFSHKRKGQSKEFLAKMAMAVEQISTFMQMALVDTEDWFGVETNNGVESIPIQPEEVELIIDWGLKKCDFLPFVGDQVKLGLIQALPITKVSGKFIEKPIYYTEKKQEGDNFKDVLKKASKMVWVPCVSGLRAEDYYPDPTTKGLYYIEETYLDISECYKLAEGPHKIYDLEKVKLLHGSYLEADQQAARKARETAQNTALNNYRKKVKIHECWGTILEQGTGKILAEKQKWTIGDDRFVLEAPKDYPFWHGDVPLIASPFIRVPHSVWHRALMDGPTQTNIALNELYNLFVDGAMMASHGIKQIRADYLEDEAQVSNGIYPGITLKINSNCPPGAKALEEVATGGIPPDAFNVFQQMSAEFSESSLTNDLRMGVQPNRKVSATAVVEASQSITSVFTGLAKVVELTFIVPVLEQMWKNILQHFTEIDRAELEDVLGKPRVAEILKMSKEELFAKCCAGYKFKVYGISGILAKQKDFRKLTGLLQTIGGNPTLMEDFSKTYDMNKLLTEIIESLDINTDKLKMDKAEQAAIMKANAAQQGQGGQPAGGPGGPQSAGPDQQSQIPQASAQGGADTVESRIPRSNFATLEGKATGGMGHG